MRVAISLSLVGSAVPQLPDPLTDVASATLVGYWKDPGSGSVSSWTNSAPAAPSSSNLTATTAPTHEAAGIGGKPSLLFNGTDQFMISDPVGATVSGNDKAFTIIMAYQAVSLSAVDRFLSFGNSGSATPLIQLYENAGVWLVGKQDDAGTGSATNVGGAIDTTVAHVFALVHSGVAVSTWVDGTIDLNADASNVAVTTIDRFTLGALRTSGGATNFNNFRVGSIAIWSSALSTTDRQTVQTILKAKYGTP